MILTSFWILFAGYVVQAGFAWYWWAQAMRWERWWRKTRATLDDLRLRHSAERELRDKLGRFLEEHRESDHTSCERFCAAQELLSEWRKTQTPAALPATGRFLE